MIAHLPERGTTAGRPNTELRCVALLGMAAAHFELGDQPLLTAEKIIAAVQADPLTAEQWIGKQAIQEILTHYPDLQTQSRHSSSPPPPPSGPPPDRFTWEDLFGYPAGGPSLEAHVSKAWEDLFGYPAGTLPSAPLGSHPCPRCQSQVAAGVRFCGVCGSPMPF